MKILVAAVPLLVLISACAPARSREPLYGPSPKGFLANDPNEISDQLSSVNSQINGAEAEMTTLESKIAAAERSKQAVNNMQLSSLLEQRGALESRHGALLSRFATVLMVAPLLLCSRHAPRPQRKM